ncbi:helix-turn-helix domain-containing protein [Oceanobacillus sp. CF4.6]|uniref:helix-turn-helix domain-containing protein n=1 Tax=Oceanobacillus sp. CF4.6 TaxID=3373080 RepID=UPI003EE67366
MECKLKEFLRQGDIIRLSEKTGVHRNTISSYIRGTAPQLDKAYKIASALNKTVYDIWPPK